MKLEYHTNDLKYFNLGQKAVVRIYSCVWVFAQWKQVR